MTNCYREVHHVPPVVWSKELEAHAQKVTDTCVWGHSMPGTGQNIGLGYSDIGDAINGFYEENVDYDYKTGSSKNGKVTGHFTQLVWNSTTEIGCAATYCKNYKATFYVCDYKPPGNVIGLYTKNVFPM
ncbi:CAP domain-containing protein [Cokeromyces recurvatus]|uniref:CAP domain-containing protein n=1 Tax=Cokeromyces recurvatus TaxID=90255 RepID=UPI002220ADE7|nr:CAP domain-containing protein [Cokeromyces recurvatus]XP_051379754.1 CAP domain-containing protein [Cokeromyces recurvatus]KAI7899748.1 CAP domain-containing protein [Cokeromyces recurvatus]KAI7899769.1 CAP domain-containing protein [Cokeromyces recurvatus]